MPLRILLPSIRIQELLHLRHPRIRLRAKPQLYLHQRLETRIQIRHPEVDELGQLGEELVVEGLVGGFGEVGFALCARQLGGVFVGFFDEFFHAGAGGVVVEELVVAFFDAWGFLGLEWVTWKGERWGRGRSTFVYVGEIGAEAGDGFEDCLSIGFMSRWR